MIILCLYNFEDAYFYYISKGDLDQAIYILSNAARFIK